MKKALVKGKVAVKEKPPVFCFNCVHYIELPQEQCGAERRVNRVMHNTYLRPVPEPEQLPMTKNAANDCPDWTAR